MFKSLRGRIITLLVILGVAGWQLFSNGIKLGLDLQGGMHLVLEVEDPDGTLTAAARADAISTAERVVRSRIDELGVEEPLIQRVGDDRLIVELPGVTDPDRAREIVSQAAFLEFKLVLSTIEVEQALPRIDQAIVQVFGADSLRAMGRAVEGPSTTGPSIEDLFFGTGDTAQAALDTLAADTLAADTTQVASPEEDDATVLRPLTALLNTGDFAGTYMVATEDVAVAQMFLGLPQVEALIPRTVALQWGEGIVASGARTYRRLYVLQADAFMDGTTLVNALAQRDPQFNQPQVVFELSRAGGRAFERFTSLHIGDNLAIVLDGEVVSAPVVQGVISTRGQIDLGGASLEEARDLALVLRAGALPAPLVVMEERTVGPSLGQDSIEQGQLAGLVGLFLVVGVMIGYYRTAGVLAVAALSVYVLLVLGGLAGLGATLTLPGIAGLILSVGMAVDANVLIFERIREELVAGRATRTAVDEGFGNALSAIVDANITTLITALILFQFGTGPVRGFAVTLSIGIAASFFTALYVTRTLFLLYLQRRKASDPISI